MTIEEIDKEIEWRESVLPTLVGSLYPSVVLGDLSRLRSRKCEIESILRRENRETE